MTRRRQWLILGALCALYLIGLGVLAGIVSERLRFDGIRSVILRQLEDATRRARAGAMVREHAAQAVAPSAASRTDAPAPPPWRRDLNALDAALTRGDVSAAERAWREAYGAALRTRAWRPLMEVGDAALRIGTAAGHHRPYRAKARELYLAALTLARAHRSVDGVLHVAEAFEALGDRAVVEQCLIIAEGMEGARDSEASQALRALAGRAVEARSMPSIEP